MNRKRQQSMIEREIDSSMRYLNHRHRILSTPFSFTAVCLKSLCVYKKYSYPNTTHTMTRTDWTKRARSTYAMALNHSWTPERDQSIIISNGLIAYSGLRFSSVPILFYLCECVSSYTHTHTCACACVDLGAVYGDYIRLPHSHIIDVYEHLLTQPHKSSTMNGVRWQYNLLSMSIHRAPHE